MTSSTLVDKMDASAERLARTARGIVAGTISLKADVDQRIDLALDANDLVNSFAEGSDWLMITAAKVAHLTAVRLFIKWKAFEHVPVGNEAAMSYADLAAKAAGDVSLITRIGRILVANGSLKSAGSDCAAVQFIYGTHVNAFLSMPKYFDHFGPIEPNDRLQSVVAFAEGHLGSTVWEVLRKDEERHKNSAMAMAAFEGMAPALGSYDLSWAAEEAHLSDNRVLVVDVDGVKGQALVQIFKALPALPRHPCVLEDLPEVIVVARRDNSELEEVEMVAMAFHREQPVKGALVYYIRHCLRNYSDNESVAILQRLADAMVADSRLLIVEFLVADPPTAIQELADLTMIVMSGKEANAGKLARRRRQGWTSEPPDLSKQLELGGY